MLYASAAGVTVKYRVSGVSGLSESVGSKNLLAAQEMGMQTVLFNRDGEEYEGNVVNDFQELGGLLRKISKR